METSYFFIILLSIALAMDAFAVSISLGMAGLAKDFINRLKIAITFGLFQALLFGLGFLSLTLFNQKMNTLNSLISIGLLAILGFKMMTESYFTEVNHCPHKVCLGLQCDNKKCDRTGQYRFLTHKLLLIFALATSIDAFAAGVSYGLIYKQLYLTTISIGLVTFILSFLGAIFGDKLKSKTGKFANLLGGSLLLFLAILTLFKTFLL